MATSEQLYLFSIKSLAVVGIKFVVVEHFIISGLFIILFQNEESKRLLDGLRLILVNTYILGSQTVILKDFVELHF